MTVIQLQQTKTSTRTGETTLFVITNTMSAITKILLDRIKHITHSTCYSGSQKEAKITEIKVIMRKVQRSKSLELQQQAEAIVWISVDERLPETLQDVIAINEDKEIYIDFICKD